MPYQLLRGGRAARFEDIPRAEVKVLKPASLRDRLRDEAQRLAQLYPPEPVAVAD